MKKTTNVGTGERALSGVLGIGLLAFAHRKNSLILGLIGAELGRRALTGQSFTFSLLDVDTRRPKSVTHGSKHGIFWSKRSVTINRSREEVYGFLKKFDLGGSVRLVDAPAQRGTEVHVELEYSMPAGKLGLALSKLAGRDPDQQLRADLRRLKKLIETGEIITTQGQPSGRVAA